jgi:hypothetical protein
MHHGVILPPSSARMSGRLFGRISLMPRLTSRTTLSSASAKSRSSMAKPMASSLIGSFSSTTPSSLVSVR